LRIYEHFTIIKTFDFQKKLSLEVVAERNGLMCLYNLILQEAFAILKIVDQEIKYVLRVSKFFENLKDSFVEVNACRLLSV